jgi:phosphohistidine phosphatase
VRTLSLLRHAKSSWDDPSLSDAARPLAPRGRRDAARIADHLVTTGFEPELVLCSPAVRTRETLELVRDALGDPTVVFDDGLYGASSGGLLARLRLVEDAVASVLLIGHNPGLHDLALDLASSGNERERLETKFPTGALATLTFPETWRGLAAGDADLAAFVIPKQLG